MGWFNKKKQITKEDVGSTIDVLIHKNTQLKVEIQRLKDEVDKVVAQSKMIAKQRDEAIAKVKKLISALTGGDHE